MKVLFYYRIRESPGVEYLSAILKKAGHKVELLFDPGLDNAFYYRNKLLKVFNNERLLIEKAKKFSPDLLAFSSTTNEYPYVRHMAHELKQRVKVPVIVGGIHPTAVPDHVLNNPDIDMICRGEGEEAFLELVNGMSRGKDVYNTRNIWFKKRNGAIVRNDLRPLIEDLDSLPFPDKDLFFNNGCFADLLLVLSGRGCPFNCTYCHNRFLRKLYKDNGEYVRRRSVGNVIAELKVYKEKYKGKKISFEDDLFVKDKDWLREFSHYYAREINLPFYCNAFPLLMDEETISILKEAGCRDLFIGIDSGSKAMRQKVLERNTAETEIKKNIGLIKKYKIPMELSIIFGWPDEKPQDMWESVRLIDELSPTQVQTHLLYPYPETEIMNYCKDKGLIDDEVLLRIYNGESSNVEESIFKHPHRDLAYTIAKLLPLYVKMPFFLKPVIKKLMHLRMKRLANIIFVMLVPFLYPSRGFSRLKEFIMIAILSKRKSTYDISS